MIVVFVFLLDCALSMYVFMSFISTFEF